MPKLKIVVLATAVALSGLSWACSGTGTEGNKPAAGNTAPAPATNQASNAAPTTTVSIPGMSADTQQLFELKCALCHGKDAKGIKNAPNLLTVDDKHTSEEWVAYLNNPKIWDKDNNMPKIPLTPEEAKKLGDWLAATTGKNAAADDKGEKGEMHEKNEKSEKGEKSEGKS